MRHYPLRHPYEPVAGVDAPVRADCERVAHAVDEGADAAPAGKYAPAEVADVHHFHRADIFERFIEEVYEQVAVFGGFKSPFLRVL